MVFTSLTYVGFLLATLVLYFAVPTRRQSLLLVIASYLFYAYWKPQYLLLLLGITTIDYLAAVGIEGATRPAVRRLWLGLSIGSNLGLLFFYKYYDFIVSQFNLVAAWLGFHSSLPILDLLIPLGISFHTFQSISYTVDVYRGACKAERNYLSLALFISFFPQLVAGPIERAGHLLPQLVRPNRFTLQACMSGALLVAYGFFKKLVLADNLAVLVDEYFVADGETAGGCCLLAVYAFAFQIYFDFSGYTDIARGSGRMLGITMIENFRAPYFATSVREFWRRWHISLTDWFREFVYQPLLERGAGRAWCVTTVFALSGIWHGANWTYLVWGLLNACFYFAMKDDRRLRHLSGALGGGLSSGTLVWAVVRCVVTFHLICLTWVFFRAADVGEALAVLRRIAGGMTGLGNAVMTVCIGHPTRVPVILVALVIDGCLAMWSPGYGWIDHLAEAKSWRYWCVMALLLYGTLMFGQLGAQQFIYFQF